LLKEIEKKQVYAILPVIHGLLFQNEKRVFHKYVPMYLLYNNFFIDDFISFGINSMKQYSRPLMKITKKKIRKSINQSINHSLTYSINQSINQSDSKSFSQSVNESVSQSVSQSMSQSVNQSVNEPVGQSIKVSVSQ